jgi:hypothetical protein
MPGEHLDITDDAPTWRKEDAAYSKLGRNFVGVHFKCCDVYIRVYVNSNRTAYDGNCPKCAKPVKLRIAPGGTDARFFTAG